MAQVQKSQLCHLLAVEPQTSYLLSLGLSSLIWKRAIIQYQCHRIVAGIYKHLAYRLVLRAIQVFAAV